MNEAPCGDDADDAGSQRHFVIDEDDIGTPAFGKDATISEAGGPGRVCRYQVPGLGERQYAVSGEAILDTVRAGR